MLHGEAVSVGMMGEAEIAEKLALLDRKAVRWVLLWHIGEAVVGHDVPQDVVQSAIEEIEARLLHFRYINCYNCGGRSKRYVDQ